MVLPSYFFASNPRSDVPDEVEILSCKLDELTRHLDTLKCFSQSAHVDENEESVLDLVMEEMEEQDETQFDESEVDGGEYKDEGDVVREVTSQIEERHESGAPIEEVLQKLAEKGFSDDEAESAVENLRRKGELYQPVQGYLRTI